MKKVIFAILSIFFLAILLFLFITSESEKKLITVITYHNIEPNPPMNRISYSIDNNKFKEHIKILKEKNYNLISFDEFDRIVANSEKRFSYKTSSQNDIMITIDDGKRNNYNYALPIARQYNAKMNLFIIGHRLLDLDEGYMTKKQIKEMIDTKLFQVGAHSYNMHYKKDGIEKIKKRKDEKKSDYKKRIDRDILKSINILEKNLDVKVNKFAYPYGVYTEQAINCLKKRKIDYAFTTDYGTYISERNKENDYKIKRINIDGICSKNRLILEIEFFKRLEILKDKIKL